MGSTKENGSITITRRQLLFGAGAAGLAASVWFLGNRGESRPSSLIPGVPISTEKISDPVKDRAAITARAVLSGDVTKVNESLAIPKSPQILQRDLNLYVNCKGIPIDDKNITIEERSPSEEWAHVPLLATCNLNDPVATSTQRKELIIVMRKFNGEFKPADFGVTPY